MITTLTTLFSVLTSGAGGGIVGAITGRAIYEGTLDVAEAQRLCDEA